MPLVRLNVRTALIVSNTEKLRYSVRMGLFGSGTTTPAPVRSCDARSLGRFPLGPSELLQSDVGMPSLSEVANLAAFNLHHVYIVGARFFARRRHWAARPRVCVPLNTP